MSMVDVYIKATDEADAIAKCPASFRATMRDTSDIQNDSATVDIWVERKPGEHQLVIIGPMLITPAAQTDISTVGTPEVLDTGFHMNVRCTQAVADQIDASIKISAPSTPKFTWSE